MNHKTHTTVWTAFFFLCAFNASAADRPNVLFIVVDDMGWRDLGCYGHKIHETPHIDKLAAGGMRFTNGYAACPVCSPTRASIMAGKYPSRTGTRVPWIVQWPGVTKPGSVCNKPVISTDFYPTLLELTGQALRPEQHLDGVSLAPLLKGDADFDRGPMIWHYPHYLPRHHAEPGSAIRIGDWKFIQYYEDGRQELYNLKRDLGESDNLAKRMPEKAAEMRAQLDAMLKEHGAKIPAPDPGYKKE